MEYTEADSRSVQQNRKTKPWSSEERDRALGNGEVRRRFEKYATVGRTRKEGPMAPTAALEEAMEDVFGGGTGRGYRRFAQHATEENIKRMKALRLGKGPQNNAYLGDEVNVRAQVRKIDDQSQLVGMLQAEYAGRNDTGSPRDPVLRIIKARMDDLDRTPAETGVATQAELDAALADD